LKKHKNACAQFCLSALDSKKTLKYSGMLEPK
jgi:hypothetical protein